MVENNEQGRKIRRYLIEVEKEFREKWKMNVKKFLKDADPLKLIEISLRRITEESKENNKLIVEARSVMESMDNIISQQREEIESLKKRIGDEKNVQTNIAALASSEMLMTVEEAWEKLGIARNTLYLKMRARKMLKKDNSPYKNYEGRYFIQRETFYKRGDSVAKTLQTYILPLGFDFLKANFGQ